MYNYNATICCPIRRKYLSLQNSYHYEYNSTPPPLHSQHLFPLSFFSVALSVSICHFHSFFSFFFSIERVKLKKRREEKGERKRFRIVHTWHVPESRRIHNFIDRHDVQNTVRRQGNSIITHVVFPFLFRMAIYRLFVALTKQLNLPL